MRTASKVTPLRAYSTPALVEPAVMPVGVLSVYSQLAHAKTALPALHVAAPIAGVPPLALRNNHTRKGTAFDVPSVAPFGMVKDSADEMALHVVVPVAAVVDRNGTSTGLDAFGVPPLAVVTLIVRAPLTAEDDRPRLTGMSKPVCTNTLPHSGPEPAA